MTLYDIITRFNKIGFDVKFDSYMNSSGFQQHGTDVALRYHGKGGTKIENKTMLTTQQMESEQLIIAALERLYEEMKPHAIGHQTMHFSSTD